LRVPQREGYLMIDNRASPGIRPEDVPDARFSCVGEGQLFEARVFTCSHCQAQMIENKARKRARAFCFGCGKYICDTCEAVRVNAGGGCRPFAAIIDKAMAKGAIRALTMLKQTLGELHG